MSNQEEQVDPRKLVALRNGTQEVLALVVTTKMTLGRLISTHPGVFYGLVMKCRDPEYALFGEGILKREHLVEPDGTVDASIRNVVLSMVSGDTIQDITIHSPIAPEPRERLGSPRP